MWFDRQSICIWDWTVEKSFGTFLRLLIQHQKSKVTKDKFDDAHVTSHYVQNNKKNDQSNKNHM